MAEHCQSCTEGIKNLKNRATREFYYEEERISDEHRAYLKSLTNAFPFSNNIYENGEYLSPEDMQKFCMFELDQDGKTCLKNLHESAYEITNDFRMRANMPVDNLKYLPRSDCFKAEIGGRPMSSHTYDYDLFGVILSYRGVSIGISPGRYKNLVAEMIDKHRDELEDQGIVDEDPFWDFRIKELMVNNLATFYLAKAIVTALRRIPKASLAEIQPAQSKPSIYNNNHMVIIDPIRVDPDDLIMVLSSLGILTCSIMSIGGDASACKIFEDSHESKLWTEGSGEGQSITSDSTISLFTGNLFVGCRGDSSNTYGIAGESFHAPDMKGKGLSHGVVVYEDGFLKISIPESEEISKVHFHRLLFYHTFYKIIRSMGLEKGSLLKCPSELTLRQGKERMRILSDGLALYHALIDDVWEDSIHHNGWLRIELRITTDHAADWRELHFGLLFHLLENTSLLKSMGFTVVPWEVLTRYQTTVISWTKRILELPPVNVSADTYQMKPAKRGRMSTAQVLALATAQSCLGWSRTRFWPKLFRLSDLALYAIANLGALLVGENAIGGGLILIGEEEARVLGIANVEQKVQWMSEKRGHVFGVMMA